MKFNKLNSIILIAIGFVFIFFVIWACTSEIVEVARGIGKVIPSSQIQVVQNLEGGILSEINVADGKLVKKGDNLLILDNTKFGSVYKEKRAEYFALLARVTRLEAETNNIDLNEVIWPKDLIKFAPELIEEEKAFAVSRKDLLSSKIKTLKSQINEHKQEINSLAGQLTSYREQYDIARKKFKITKPMVDSGATSQIQLLEIQKELSGLRGKVKSTSMGLRKEKEARDGLYSKIEGEKKNHRNESISELTEKKAKLNSLKQAMPAIKDRLDRTIIKSPVEGTIKQVLVNTIGGVVQPGQPLVEIVPYKDNLLIEAKIFPKDIAFINPRQKVNVKFTAYDFSIYGGLNGVIETIGADSITERDGSSFYIVKIRTKKSHLGSEESPLVIIPGMVAQVDIITGHRTIADFILKPIIKARENALKER
jgi:adhesin transport system membrane fusion protein